MTLIRRILNTSVFRLSLIYAVLFSLIAAAALLSVYKVAENQIRQQIDTRLSLETNLLLENYKKHAVKGLTEDINIYNKKEGRPFYIYALIHKSKLDLNRFVIEGKNTAKSNNRVYTSIPISDIVEYAPDRPNQGIVRILLTVLPGGYQLLVGAELQETQTLLSQLFKATLIAISVIFALSTIIGTLMAQRMLKRINDVTNTADNIIEGNLSHRIPVVSDRNNELDRLGRSLNRMLDRNEELMRSMREVTNNLAHDMRNPLNRIRHRIESAKYAGITEQDFDQLTDDTIRDLDNVISTFNALLSIAQVESGAPRKDRIEFQLNTLLDDLAEVYELVATEQNLVWEYDVEKDLLMNGNRHLIAQLFTNLLDNAFKYSPEGGKVSLTARHVQTLEKKPQIAVTITDNGPGIPAEEHQNVFKRFYRLDNARSTEGNGLGLSLVKAAADLHNANIEFSDNHPGLCVKVNFKLKK